MTKLLLFSVVAFLIFEKSTSQSKLKFGMFVWACGIIDLLGMNRGTGDHIARNNYQTKVLAGS